MQKAFQPAKALELGPSGWSLGGSRVRLDTLDMSRHVREPHGRLPVIRNKSVRTVWGSEFYESYQAFTGQTPLAF